MINISNDFFKSAESPRFVKTARRKQLDLKYYVRDFKNRVLYDAHAPRCFERLWINPYNCRYVLPGQSVKIMTGVEHKKSTAKVVTDTWESDTILPFSSTVKFKSCLSHWKNGIPWDRTGAIDNVMQEIHIRQKKFDNCKTRREVELRYRRLDKIYETIKKEGSFRSRKEINPYNFRERGGVMIHIGPGGELFFGNSGNHRLSIALLLGIYLPATIGCVHISALDHLNELRKKKYGRPSITEHYEAFFKGEDLLPS